MRRPTMAGGAPARAIEYLVGILGNAAGALREVKLQRPQAWGKVDGAFQRLQAVAEAGPRHGLMEEEEQAKPGGNCCKNWLIAVRGCRTV